MAYRDVEDWHRTTTRRRYPQGPLPVADHGWRAGGQTSLDSLPYRRPKDLIQGPDEITSPPGRSRTSRNSSGASATVIETMPVPVLSRAPVTETYRRGRYPAADYAYDDFGETESPTPGRRRSSTTSESGTDTETDEESATSISTQEEKRQRRHERAKREKDRGKHEKRTHRLVQEERRPPPEERKKKTPKRRRKIKEIVAQCMICMDEHRSSKVPKLKCGHRMCESCLEWRFQLSITDPQSMPPRCCTPDVIPLKYVERLLSSDFKMNWNRKYLEYSTRNRIYCSSRRCGAWIRPSDIYRRGSRKCGSCRVCGTDVCCSCKGKWHSSRDCPDDEDTTRFLEQAKEAGWQRCYKCNHMIELEEGCNHMTCRCGAQFCMICGVKWKNCDCPWFNYDTTDADRLPDVQIPAVIQRLERLDLTMTSRGMRPALRSGPSPRSRSQDYEDRLVRRFQDNRDDDTRRFSSYGDDDVLDRGYGELTGANTTIGNYASDDYRREADDVFVSGPPVPPAPTPPAAFERPTPTDYMSGVNRARGLPQDKMSQRDSMGQRLADRFSEFRSSPGGPSRSGMMGPPPPHTVSPLGPMTASPMGPPPPPLTAPLGMGPAPPMPMLRRHTMEEELYNSARAMRPSERVVHGRMAHDYEAEAAIHATRSRRRSYAEPKSSTLAGLTGPGRGMNRVFEWRNHVHPGDPEDGSRA
ncbi:putative E3 ubiquitin-protein ligase ARI4 [Colletotrichum siamense]|uniref:RBR-type E3 ubiquitin transferase n=1 Tax=Colletotrichum siamense TaxID=690259 RepID=A0A9P5EC37_COLSI|nr:putative E3 ubiquitin-protein ligase ARI4 [Colletotrichum siamense]